MNAVPVLDDSGQLDQVVVTFIDVTDRRLAEARLAEAEEESRLVFDRSRSRPAWWPTTGGSSG